MPFVKWYDNLSVKVPSIDEQHQQLIEMINTLYDAIGVGKEKSMLEELVDQLEDYAKNHFATEEKYFEQFKFSEAEEHTQEHRQFIEKVEEFKVKFHQGSMVVSVEILRFLNKWLVSHLAKEDQKYVTLYIENGVK